MTSAGVRHYIHAGITAPAAAGYPSPAFAMNLKSSEAVTWVILKCWNAAARESTVTTAASVMVWFRRTRILDNDHSSPWYKNASGWVFRLDSEIHNQTLTWRGK